jgi:hypothetical protein
LTQITKKNVAKALTTSSLHPVASTGRHFDLILQVEAYSALSSAKYILPLLATLWFWDTFGVPIGLVLCYNSTSFNHLSHLEAFLSISLLFLPFPQHWASRPSKYRIKRSSSIFLQPRQRLSVHDVERQVLGFTAAMYAPLLMSLLAGEASCSSYRCASGSAVRHPVPNRSSPSVFQRWSNAMLG